jgi:hypothetical protein
LKILLLKENFEFKNIDSKRMPLAQQLFYSASRKNSIHLNFIAIESSA